MLLWPDFFTPRLTGGTATGVKERPPGVHSRFALCGGFVAKMCCLSSETVRKQAGYDGYMLARLVHCSLVVFGVYTLFSLAVLVPVCFTASDDETDAVIRAGLDNVPEGSPRLWAFTVSAFVLTGLTCVMLYRLAVEYALVRRAFLRASVLRGAPKLAATAAAAGEDGASAAGKDRSDSDSGSAATPSSAVDAAQVRASPSASPAAAGAALPLDTRLELRHADQGAVRAFGDDGSTAWPRTVMALDVPPHVRNSSQLLEMFRALYPGEVQAAVLVTGIHGVRRLQQEREWLTRWYEAARWQHTQRHAPTQRAVYARQCRFIACLWRECFHWDPVYTEEGKNLEHAPAEAEQDRLRDAEREVHKHNKKRVQAPAVPGDTQRFVRHAQAQRGQGAGFSAEEDVYADDAAWEGPDSDARGAYCCCCLPCGLCKRGRCCHCLVANKTCCGSVQPALPRLRNELLRINALLVEQRHRWWRRALPHLGESARTPKAGGGASIPQAPGVSPTHQTPEDAKPPKPQYGGTGFITFRTARQAVTAANSYHIPASMFDATRDPSPPGADGGQNGEGDATPDSDTQDGTHPDDTRVRVLSGALNTKAGAREEAATTEAAGVWRVLGHTRMSVRQAPHPLDVNFHSCTLNSAETVRFRALVGLILFVMLLVYSVLAVLLAAGGGEEGDAREEDTDASFFTELYQGVIQSLLLTLLLALLPLFVHLLGRLSRFRERSEMRQFTIAWLFFFKAWVGIVMVTLGESVQAVIQRVAEQPFDSVEVLGNDLPQFASFYVSFILLKALADLPRKLLQTAQFLYFLIRFRTCPNVRGVLCVFHGRQSSDEQSVRPTRDTDKSAGDRGTAAAATAPAAPVRRQHARSSCSKDEGNTDAEAGAEPELGDGSATSGQRAQAHFLEPTPRRDPHLERQAEVFGLSPREYFERVVQGGSRFRYEDDLTDVLFVLLIGFIFGAMVPILPPLIALTMAVMGMVYKYKLVYRKTQWMDTGAAFMPAALRRVAFGAAGHCAVMSALLYERDQVVPASITLIPLVFVVAFSALLQRKVMLGADKLSLQEAVAGDRAHGRMGGPAENGEEDDDPDTLGDASDGDAALRMRRLIGRHAYVPDCMIPARDSQPGVVQLPPLSNPTTGLD